MPSSTVVAALYCVVDQSDGDVSGFTPLACGPSCQVVVHVVGPPEASPAPLGVPSLFQRTEPAVVVVVGNVAVVAPLPTWSALPPASISAGSNFVMRGPRPPDGLLISATCLSVLAPLPVFQARLTVTRRKSSGWISGSSVPAEAGTGACGVQTLAGGVAATLSFGSSKVQTSAVTVYWMPRRDTIHGEGEPVTPPLACSTSRTFVGVSES